MNDPTHDPVRIEPATEGDLPAIAALAGVIWRACYPDIISSAQIDYMLAQMYGTETLRDEIRNGGIRYYRLLMADALVGFASCGPATSPNTFKLHKLYLHPKYHGRGLGSRLLRHCEGEARRLGGCRIVLTVNKNNAPAIAVYQRNGFAVVDSVVTDIGGGFVMDDYIMAKPLG